MGFLDAGCTKVYRVYKSMQSERDGFACVVISLPAFIRERTNERQVVDVSNYPKLKASERIRKVSYVSTCLTESCYAEDVSPPTLSPLRSFLLSLSLFLSLSLSLSLSSFFSSVSVFSRFSEGASEEKRADNKFT